MLESPLYEAQVFEQTQHRSEVLLWSTQRNHHSWSHTPECATWVCIHWTTPEHLLIPYPSRCDKCRIGENFKWSTLNMQKGKTLLFIKIGIANADPAKDTTKTRYVPITAPIATYYLQLTNGKILFHHYYLSRATQFTYTPTLYLLQQTNFERGKNKVFFFTQKMGWEFGR